MLPCKREARVILSVRFRTQIDYHFQKTRVSQSPNKRKTQKLILREVYSVRSGDRIPVGAKFSARPDRPWSPPSLVYNGYRVFPGGKVRPGRAADHSPPSSAEILEEYSYASTHFWATTGPVTALLYL
jgi:hypothetical protein